MPQFPSSTEQCGGCTWQSCIMPFQLSPVIIRNRSRQAYPKWLKFALSVMNSLVEGKQ